MAISFEIISHLPKYTRRKILNIKWCHFSRRSNSSNIKKLFDLNWYVTLNPFCFSEKYNFISLSLRFVAWGISDKRSIFRVATERPVKGELQNFAHLPGSGRCIRARVCIAYARASLDPSERERVAVRASDWSRCSLLTARN
jgi:hypothetical protein